VDEESIDMSVEEQIASEFSDSSSTAVMTRKRCSRCEEWKDIDQFYARWKDDLSSMAGQSMCIPCYSATYNAEYRKSLRINRSAAIQ
jgi:hypothetical protein